jgi:hypothetical protein
MAIFTVLCMNSSTGKKIKIPFVRGNNRTDHSTPLSFIAGQLLLKGEKFKDFDLFCISGRYELRNEIQVPVREKIYNWYKQNEMTLKLEFHHPELAVNKRRGKNSVELSDLIDDGIEIIHLEEHKSLVVNNLKEKKPKKKRSKEWTSEDDDNWTEFFNQHSPKE